MSTKINIGDDSYSQARSMQDPEIQGILSDPIMRQVCYVAAVVAYE
jgi:hypothetical protein